MHQLETNTDAFIHHASIEQIHDIQAQNFIQKTMDIRAHERYKCLCSLCAFSRQESKKTSRLNIYEPLIDCKSSRDTDYVFIIKRLAPIGKRCLRIPIPETSIYNSKGDIEMIIMSQRNDVQLPDFSYSCIKKNLNLNKFMRIIGDRKLNYEKLLYYYRRNKGESPSSSEFRDQKFYDSKYFFDQPPKIIDKNNIQVITRFLLKKSRKESLEANQGRIIQECLLVKYTDQTYQILSEGEVQSMCQNLKKFDWSNVLYAQQYYKPSRGHHFSRIQFQLHKYLGKENFIRSLNEILYIKGEISHASEDYIPAENEEDFEQKLFKSSEQEYLLYLIFKIHHYLKLFHNVSIDSGEFDFMRDDMNQYFFTSAQRVKVSTLQNKFEISQPKVDESNKKLIDQSMSFQEDEYTSQIKSQMTNYYQNKKNQLNLSQPIDIPRDERSQTVYQSLYPNYNLAFHQPLKKVSKKKKIFTPQQLIKENPVKINESPSSKLSKKYFYPQQLRPLTETVFKTQKIKEKVSQSGSFNHKVSLAYQSDKHFSQPQKNNGRRYFQKNSLPFYLFQGIGLQESF